MAYIEIADGDKPAEDLADLLDWLGRDKRLRGKVDVERRDVGEGKMGTLTDALVVALDDGGAVTALIASVGTWLAARRSRVRIKVRRGDRTVELDGRVKPDQIEPILRELLDDDRPGDKDG
ncbi:MAG TPA: hypothetical protein VM677_24175 [Actinokineospora sp.]|nr:hypothetical protein [Actinokineospora sp.]